MAYIMVVNRSHFPIHGALSWGTMQTDCFNNLPPGASHDFVVGLGWTDLTIVTARKDGSNQFDPAQNGDPTRLFKLAAVVAAGIAGPGGVLAAGGLLLSKDDAVRLGALGALPPDAAYGDVTIKAANIQIHPAMATQLYCPDGWTVTVTGNEVKSTFDSVNNVLTINSITPLHLFCGNRNGNPNRDFDAPA